MLHKYIKKEIIIQKLINKNINYELHNNIIHPILVRKFLLLYNYCNELQCIFFRLNMLDVIY